MLHAARGGRRWLLGGFGDCGARIKHRLIQAMKDRAARVFVIVTTVLKNSVNGAAVVAGDLLAFAGDLGQRHKCFQQIFGVDSLLAPDIPEALPPVTGRRWVVVLCAEGQGSNGRVAQVPLIGVVAVDAQASSA